MKKTIKTDELISSISSLLKKNRGTLSGDEIQAVEKTISVLMQLGESDESKIQSLSEELAQTALILLTKPEIFELLIECFNEICN